MGSSGNSNPWGPYSSSPKDCSQGVCSIYCPQWCYIIFPPPPPFDLVDDGASSADFSPLIIAVIGILASAFILITYYTFISRYCRRRGSGNGRVLEPGENLDQFNNENWHRSCTGLDEALIKSIAVLKYKKGDGVVDGNDCSICLSEFEENESLRLLPKCNHAFHLPCVDTWLKSHSSCPLCRCNIAPINNNNNNNNNPSAASPAIQVNQTPGVNLPVPEIQPRSNDTVLVFQDLQSGNVRDEAAVSVVVEVVNEVSSKEEEEEEGEAHAVRESSGQGDAVIEVRDEVFRPLRRSASLNSGPRQRRFSVADILSAGDEDEDDDDDDDEEEEEAGKRALHLGIGCAVGVGQEQSKSNAGNGVFNLAMKRSLSTGRFVFSRHGRGKGNMIIPH